MNHELSVSGLYLGSESGLEGIIGDKHAGFTRASDSQTPEYQRGTLIRNNRQWSAVSPEELSLIAESMGIPFIDPAWLGANLALSGIPNLTELPKGTKLRFPEETVLLIEGENMPCTGPGEVIASKYPEKGLKANSFPKAAFGKRGLIGVVERPGIIKLNDVVTVQIYQPKMFSLPPNLK